MRAQGCSRHYLHELTGNLETLGNRKLPKRRALRFNPETGSALLRGGHANISNEWPSGHWVPNLVLYTMPVARLFRMENKFGVSKRPE